MEGMKPEAKENHEFENGDESKVIEFSELCEPNF